VRSVEEMPSVQTRRVSIDANFVAVATLLALALAAFGYLNSRIDTLSGRLDNVATDLRGEIKQVGTEMKRYAERTDDKIDKLTEKMDKLTERTDDKIDRLNDKIDKLSAETNDKFDRLTEKLNELIIAQSRAN